MTTEELQTYYRLMESICKRFVNESTRLRREGDGSGEMQMEDVAKGINRALVCMQNILGNENIPPYFTGL